MSEDWPGVMTGPDSLVERTRLVAGLDEEPPRPITVVTAGAGFGKSSLIRQWLATQHPIWLDLTPADRDAPAFLAHLADRWDRAVGDARTAASLHAAAGRGEGVGPETQARFVALAMERGTDASDVARWIVLDDLHEIGDGSASAMIGALVRQLPPRVRVVAVTRTTLPFPIQRLRVRGAVRELSAQDLAFNEVELREVLERGLGRSGPALARDVMTLTEGWPATVRLVVEALRPLAEDRWSSTLIAEGFRAGGLFAYLAEEVLDREPVEVIDVIRTIAPFDAVDLELCAELGLVRAESVLDDLARRGLFVRRTGIERGYVLHRLIREYATERLPLDDDRLTAGWRIAASWHARHGRPEDALRQALASRDAALIDGLIRDVGPELLAHGQADLVVEAVERLPPERTSAECVIALGDAHAFRGRSSAALAAYERARSVSPVDGPDDAPLPTPADLAWRIARVHLELGDPSSARAVLDSALSTANATDEALLLGYRALVGFSTNDPSTVPTSLQAVAAADRSGNATARSIAHTAASYALGTRDPALGRRHHRIALETAELAGDVVQVVRLRNADDEGRTLDEQFDTATETLNLIEAAGNPVLVVRTLVNRGLLALDLGRFEVAGTDFARARQLAIGLGSLTEIMPLVFEAELARIRGDLAQAALGFERTIASADAVGDARFGAYARAGLARLLARSEPARSRLLVERALVDAADHDRPDYIVAAAWIAACQDRPADARRHAQEAIAVVGLAPGRSAALASAIEVDALVDDDAARRRSRLDEAAAIWERIGNTAAAAQTRLAIAIERSGPSSPEAAAARAAVEAAGIRPAAAEMAGILALLPSGAGPAVSVRLLGGFAVLRSGRPVAVGEWKSRKARHLLKILVARRGAPITRDELIDELWPDQERATSSNGLSVALSLLRRVLDPDRTSAADRYVIADRQAVALRTAALEIDLEAFVVDAQAGLKRFAAGSMGEALPLLAAAETRYAGDVLPEDVHADWSMGPREEARGLYVRVATALAELAIATGDPALAGRYLMRAIAVEPYDEASHLGLVRALAVEGRRSEARRAYQAYVARMAELEVEPAPYPAGD